MDKHDLNKKNKEDMTVLYTMNEGGGGSGMAKRNAEVPGSNSLRPPPHPPTIDAERDLRIPICWNERKGVVAVGEHLATCTEGLKPVSQLFGCADVDLRERPRGCNSEHNVHRRKRRPV